MLNKVQRSTLAQMLIDKVAGKHGDSLRLAGVYGSTRRGDDTPWSDIDLLCVVRHRRKLKLRSFLYHNVAVVFTTIDEQELLEHLEKPTAQWPFWMGVLDGLLPLAGDTRLKDKWLAKGHLVDDNRFRDVLIEILPGMVYESYGRILSCKRRGDDDNLRISIYEMLLEMNRVLCLLNRRWVSRDYLAGIEAAADFERLPAGYAELAPKLWRTADIDSALPPAQKLYNSYQELLRREGLAPHNYTDFNELSSLL